MCSGVILIYDTSCYGPAVSSFHACNSISLANLRYVSQCCLCRAHFYFIQLRALWKQDTSFLPFQSSEEGAAAAASTDRCFSSQSLPPATFPHHMIYPVLQKTRGKVAAHRRLDTGQNWQRSTHKSCYARIYDTPGFTTKPCNTQLLSRTIV